MYKQKRRLDASVKYKTETAGSLSSAQWSLPTTSSFSVSSEACHPTDTVSSPSSPPAVTGLTPAVVKANYSSSDQMAQGSVRKVAPIELPLRDPLVAYQDTDFVPLEDIPSHQSASLNSKLMNESHLAPLYPEFMRKVRQVAATLDQAKVEHRTTAQEAEQQQQLSCFHNMWSEVKKLLSSEKELVDTVEENQIRRSLLFWHRGHRTATTTPKSHTDYVIASFVNEKRNKNSKKHLKKSAVSNPDMFVQDFNESLS